MQADDRLSGSPTLHAERDTDIAQVAASVVSTWQRIDLALAPILGKRGVATLYRRSVFLAAVDHPWLAPLHDAAGEAIDLPALKAILLEQGGAKAANGAVAMLRTFREVLASLIGAALSERLLGAAWQDLPGAIAAQGHAT